MGREREKGRDGERDRERERGGQGGKEALPLPRPRAIRRQVRGPRVSRVLVNAELQTDEHVQLTIRDLAGHEMNSVNCETFITGPCVPRQDKNTTSTWGHAVSRGASPAVGVGRSRGGTGGRGCQPQMCGSRCGRERPGGTAEGLGRGLWAAVPRERRA